MSMTVGILGLSKDALSRTRQASQGVITMQAVIQSSPLINDPMIPVTLIDGSGTGTTSEWAISLNLTDRWGDINDTDREKKPLADLENNPALHEQLLKQMYCEDTFVVRKDGQYGILFELEFMSQE